MSAIDNALMDLIFESALDWNRRHPPGTSVTLTRSDGSLLSTRTRSWASQWGSFAVLQLQHVDGLWTISALTVTHNLFDGQ